MKRTLILIIILFAISNISAIKITEVELNPPGDDKGNEWIELYNDGNISLEGYTIINNDGDAINLTGTFDGYFIYAFTKQWLDNSNESISLYKNSELVDRTIILEDSKNNDKTYQLCNSNWIFQESTKGKENCPQSSSTPEQETQEPITNSSPEEIPLDAIIDSIERSSYYPSETNNSSAKKTGLEPIKLNSQNIKTNNENENSEPYAIYGMIGFSILLAFLFIAKLRQRKKHNEFQ